MSFPVILLPMLCMMAFGATGKGASECVVPNGGFEIVQEGKALPDDWTVGIGGGADGAVAVDTQVRHTGNQAVCITNRSPKQAFVYVLITSERIPVQPEATYDAYFFARGRKASCCFLSVGFERGGDWRRYLSNGDFDWQEFRCEFTAPEGCSSVALSFASDDVTEALWVDDVSLELALQQRANLRERRYAKDFSGVFPRSKGPLARHLVVYDAAADSWDLRLLVAALQGIVNRKTPRIYLLHPTNPAGHDRIWLNYMKEKAYTGDEETFDDPVALVARFRHEIRGVVITDPELPGSVNAACMIGAIEKALPATPELAARFGLPVVADLRGRWTRNVDAYRYVYDRYWDRMNHHILAWAYPLSDHTGARDYMVEFNVFNFWVSAYADEEKGADPEAEEAFLHELFANTPANIPVMGWPAYSDGKGVPEYSGVRWLSEYGKFVPGTEFCTNLSVHGAIHPADSAFKQKHREGGDRVALQNDKIYLSVNILDSGDALWYWQLHQRKIWADPARGTVPVGWCMNVTLYDTLPLVLQWYYENATPNDTFFAAASGLGYMNTQVYGSRFRKKDRERIWREYVRLTDTYCRKLDVHGIELYNGTWGEQTPTEPQTFSQFVEGMKNLDYILADLGRHDGVDAANANCLLDGTAVFHTLTRYQVWTSSSEVIRDDMDNANAWLLTEIEANSPEKLPGFMSAMAISWYYYPSWVKDLRDNLPSRYAMVSPPDLARLYRQHTGKQAKDGASRSVMVCPHDVARLYRDYMGQRARRDARYVKEKADG